MLNKADSDRMRIKDTLPLSDADKLHLGITGAIMMANKRDLNVLGVGACMIHGEQWKKEWEARKSGVEKT